ncbi:TrkA family potassium uptake protein [Victivallaceae bacterium BBE-744-WT-12]|jgi:K+ transport (trk) system, NAD-binding component|uniref:TrkA family potassium uptake protein n=1 Tax=Victivallis lenta TaxID=2606640 RepID=A0A844FZZ3_9BACT|nr:TrkA family potassium uptake protein [Victivallis lenta]MBS1452510.1 TrkA family potassium uptake protein [Lentisphaeria bacterium]MBS5529259.1 TrkA family potassium uptake protein [bacterium]MST96940.1 TrkA family potassium uptake protein [Victivallis lenta]HBP08511.1 TrkA family potassium uptake protein [Lentisphaeria bacterium]HCH86025.1 TrkA family potassium uptake protein [Lentisphaeria bacterium]
MARNHYAVLGLGSFGAKLAVALARAGNTVLVVDIDQQRVDDLRDKVTEAIIADVSNEEVVRELNVRKFDAVILGMSSHFEDQVLALTLLKQEGVRKVIVKANTTIQERILFRLGADEVFQPEQDVAERLARRLTMDNITDLFEFKGSAIAEVTVPEQLSGQSLRQLDLRNRFNVTVLLMRKPGGSAETVMTPDTLLEKGDQLTVFGSQKSIIELFKEK